MYPKSFFQIGFACALLALVASKKDCTFDCSHQSAKHVCGSNDQTYESLCHLKKQSCLKKNGVTFKCDGACPCDLPELMTMDKDTVIKLQKARTAFQLLGHAGENYEQNKDYLVPDSVDDKIIKEHLMKTFEKKMECSTRDLAELPTRLIDWFHVLKVNEKVQEMKDQRIEDEPIMHVETFTDEKIRAMYSLLACKKQNDKETEKAVCLNPVKWMFHNLDVNGDGVLSPVELAEIEQIEKEQCIKPFLQRCDGNSDGNVELAEFCSCLCVTPPCTRLIKDIPIMILRGVPTPIAGVFVPRCDDDGFFMPQQCNPRNECWCTDRNGGELFDTRTKKGKASCSAYNTNNARTNLIPMDAQKENANHK